MSVSYDLEFLGELRAAGTSADETRPIRGVHLFERWSRLDKRRKLILRASVLAAVLVNAATAWAYHEVVDAAGDRDAPRPVISSAADYCPPNTGAH